MIGRVVGNFQFTELLGEGGIGAVYAAIDQMLGRRVAIKLLRPELAHDARFLDRFRGEAASLARLNHPNITTLYSLHSEGQELLMIIELVEGRTLEDILRASGRLSADECLALAAQATEGFAYAHRTGVVHRDIKPANLMVTADGSLKIMDFGIARIRGSQRMTRTGHIIGTLAYMAPEQIQGHEGDERSDIYSLAIVLYELLVGDPPFVADSEYQLIRAQVEEIPRSLAERLPGIDPAIDRAVMQALAKNPEARFATMTEFSRALGSTMGLTAAKETMVRRVAPLVSQLAATRQRPMITDPTAMPTFAASGSTPSSYTAATPPENLPTWSPSTGAASAAPPAPWPAPEPTAVPAPRPQPVGSASGRRGLSIPMMVLGGVVLLFIAGIGFILKDTFFASRPPQVAAPADAPLPAAKEVAEPATPVAEQPEPGSKVTSTESPGSQPAITLPSVAPAPSPPPPSPPPATPVTLQPPGSLAPLTPVTPPAKQGPAVGSVEPKQPVEESPSEPKKSEKKAIKPPTKKTVARGDEGSRRSSSETPTNQGGSGWVIRRD